MPNLHGPITIDAFLDPATLHPATRRRLIQQKLPRKHEAPPPNQEFCYGCHYPQLKDTLVRVKGFRKGYDPGDEIKAHYCQACYAQVSKCDRCGAQVPPEEYYAGTHARTCCLDCGLGDKPRLRVEQAEEFIAKSRILNHRKETVWQKTSSSAPIPSASR